MIDNVLYLDNYRGGENFEYRRHFTNLSELGLGSYLSSCISNYISRKIYPGYTAALLVEGRIESAIRETQIEDPQGKFDILLRYISQHCGFEAVGYSGAIQTYLGRSIPSRFDP